MRECVFRRNPLTAFNRQAPRNGKWLVYGSAGAAERYTGRGIRYDERRMILVGEEHSVTAGFFERIEQKYPLILGTLLVDRTTQGNILWADNEYEALGDGHRRDD